MLDVQLKIKINQLWDKFRSNGVSNPLEGIEQISYLIFMKRLEDEDSDNELNAQFTNSNYVSIFANNTNLKWSNWINMPAEDMFTHVRDNVFPFLINLGEEGSLYNKYMKNAIFKVPTSSVLVEATRIIDNLNIKEQNKDVQGDIYEYLLSQLKDSGKNGQFRTPRHIIKLIIELIKPEFGEIICDPACGTSGFLMNSYK